MTPSRRRKEVRTTTTAKRHLHEKYRWLQEHVSQREADRWYDGLLRALDKLGHRPERFTVIHEESDFGVQLREMLYGIGRRKTHRIIFAVRPEAVIVHAIRHVAEDELTPDDL
jgi:plasmid stabilization system protein ParE